jgi:predicted phage terminase large subunit-like protein
VRVARAWDTAATEAAGDYTVGLRIETLANGQTIITDVVRGQWSEKTIEDMIVSTAHRDGRNVRVRIVQERGSAGKNMVNRYARLLRGFHVRGVLETGDKELRARGMSAAGERGDLLLLAAPWNDALVEEFVQFPHGAYDDQVDAGSLAWDAVQKRSGMTVV